MNWLDRLERKFGKFALPGLMKFIIALTGGVYVIDMIMPYSNIKYKLALYPELVAKGEVWRLITYIFIPPSSWPIFIIFVLYLYYMIGTALEHEWGSFRFNVYYLIGMIGTTIAAFITGVPGTATYLNLSLFLAFAHIYPDFEILLFFVLPIKIKYLGWLNWAFIAFMIVVGSMPTRIAAVMSVVNFLVFFGKDFIAGRKTARQSYLRRKSFKEKVPSGTLVHRCEVCGLTQEDDPNMDFRYCTECDGRHAYCTEHIRNHEHIKENKVIDFPKNKM